MTLDHMYHRQLPEPVNSEIECVAAFEQTTDEIVEVVSTECNELDLDENISESDLMELSDCLDWLIEASNTGSAVEPFQAIDSSVTGDNNTLDNAVVKQCNGKLERQSSVQKLLDDLEMLAGKKIEQTTTNLLDFIENDKTSTTDDTRSCSSPYSSSGYDSDFVSSYDDDLLLNEDNSGLFNTLEEPFSDLFPALY